MRARDNPLTVQRLRAVRYRAPNATPAALLTRLEALGWRGAVVGPQGHGKTTLLEDLQPLLLARGLRPRLVRLEHRETFLRSDRRRALFVSPTPDDLLCIDGADELAAPVWHWLRWRCRNARGLLIATHREGMLPTLLRCETSVALLGELLSELGIDEDQRPGPPLEELYRRHRGNLREVLRELYDVYAGLGVRRHEPVPHPAARLRAVRR